MSDVQSARFDGGRNEQKQGTRRIEHGRGAPARQLLRTGRRRLGRRGDGDHRSDRGDAGRDGGSCEHGGHGDDHRRQRGAGLHGGGPDDGSSRGHRGDGDRRDGGRDPHRRGGRCRHAGVAGAESAARRRRPGLGRTGQRRRRACRAPGRRHVLRLQAEPRRGDERLHPGVPERVRHGRLGCVRPPQPRSDPDVRRPGRQSDRAPGPRRPRRSPRARPPRRRRTS